MACFVQNTRKYKLKEKKIERKKKNNSRFVMTVMPTPEKIDEKTALITLEKRQLQFTQLFRTIHVFFLI